MTQGCTSPNEALTFVYENAIHRTKIIKDEPVGDVLVCDSTIPFNDPIKKLIDKGITAIIQTGGTPADNEFIKYCDERGVVMVFTDMTHISF